jgi:16S rRNA (guanine(527)-N(7))-methyltransferase RsmG
MGTSRTKGMSGKYRSKGTVSQPRLPPGLPSLREWFERADLSLEDHQYKKLWMFHTLLREKNEEYDLTRIYQFDSIVQKHYIDCVLVAKILNWKLPSPLLDIGTGPGFPGIPLKIACPEVGLILSEGRHKRVQFLREVVETLGLKGVTIYDHKVYASSSLKIKGVITRALESIPKTLARVRRSLVPGGTAIFMKGPHCEEEVQKALVQFPAEYHLIQDLSYSIPRSTHRRRLILFERTSSD